VKQLIQPDDALLPRPGYRTTRRQVRESIEWVIAGGTTQGDYSSTVPGQSWFHVVRCGETSQQGGVLAETAGPSDFDVGFLVGLLIGEGHFGGDGRQPQVSLRMHTRREALFQWIDTNFPGGRLYGPYEHGGRSYYQWMARGKYLHSVILPLLDKYMSPTRDEYTWRRYVAMKERYGL
jgi:hypothetical protein